MRKVIVSDVGTPDVLKVVSSVAPVAGRREVLVDVEAAGINYLDVYQRAGVAETPRPFTPGFEGVGTVSRVGSEVSTLKVGSRVAWINVPGSYAEQIALPEAQAIAIPPSFTTGQALLFQAVTAQYLLAEYRAIQRGEFVLVHSAAGGVGQILTQWLKHLGAVVVGTASSAEKLQTIVSLGADYAVNYAAGDFLKEVLALTSGKGVDLAFDAVGKTTFHLTIKALAPRGMAVAYGQASGIAADVQVLPLILKGARVAGASLFIYIADPAEMHVRAAKVIQGIEKGWLRIREPTTFALADVASAHRAIESRSTQGKLALIP